MNVDEAIRQSETLFRAMFEQAAVGVAQIESRSGRFVRVNQRHCDIVGYTMDDMLAVTFQSITHPDDLKPLLNSMSRILTGQIREFTTEKRCFHRSGRVVWVAFTVSPLWQPGEEPDHYMAVVQDVSERKRAAAALRESEARLRAIFESEPECVKLLDREGIVIDMNPAGLAMVEADSIEQVIGESVFSLIEEKDHEQYRSLHNRVFLGETAELEFEITGLRGSRLWMETHASPVRDDEGRVVAHLAVTRDVTQAKNAKTALLELNVQLERRVAERTAELEDTNAELESFARSVSHDLRAPLRAMEGFAIALEEDCSESLEHKGRAYVRHIIAGVARMDTLINDLLTYSRLTRDDLVVTSISLDAIVRDALIQMRDEINRRGAEVIVYDPLGKVRGQAAIVTQIVTNLVSNAIKFTRTDIRPRVGVRVEARGDAMRLWVDDNGIGIDRQNHERVFQVFERLHGIEHYPGTGIGLAIVTRGAHRLGGRCGVESTPHRGSRFWVELPRVTD